MTTLEFNHKIEGLQDSLLLFTRKFTNDAEDAKDLVQETILKALRHKDKFVSNSNLKGWLYTIMRNTFINDYRRKVKNATITDSTENLHHLNAEDFYTFNNPDATLRYKDLDGVLDEVENDYQQPMRMYIEGYKYHEIAEKLDIPLGTVKARIYKARQEMKRRLPTHYSN